MQAKSKQTWAERADSGILARAVEQSETVTAAANRLGVTVPALRRAWDRYGTGDLYDTVGSNRATSAEDIDASGIKARTKNASVLSEYRTITINPESGEIWVVPGDIHGGIQDDRALDLMLRCAEHLDARVILQGDTYDCYGISRHAKSADRIRRGNWALADERDAMRPYMDRIAALGEHTDLTPVMLRGNHEARLDSLVNDEPALDGCLDIRSVFEIPDSIVIGEPGDRVRAGSLVVEHGHTIGGSLSQYGCKAVLDKQPDQTTIIGHSHRIAEFRRTTYDERGKPRTRAVYNVGHLSRTECHVSYAGTRPNWQQGFAVVEFFKGKTRKTRFSVDLVEIHDYEFCYRGDVYR